MPCQFLSVHTPLHSVSLIGLPPIRMIPQPHHNWLPFSHSANAIVQVHTVAMDAVITQMNSRTEGPCVVSLSVSVAAIFCQKQHYTYKKISSLPNL